MGRVSFPNGGEWEILLGRISYCVVGVWGVISTILTFFKAKKQNWTSIKIKINMNYV